MELCGVRNGADDDEVVADRLDVQRSRNASQFELNELRAAGTFDAGAEREPSAVAAQLFEYHPTLARSAHAPHEAPDDGRRFR